MSGEREPQIESPQDELDDDEQVRGPVEDLPPGVLVRITLRDE